MIAVLTSGGDAPGMNALIAGVSEADPRALAVEGGFRGLSEGRMVALDPVRAREQAGVAGTWLGSSRHPALREPAGLEACRAALEHAGVQGLVVAGGNGSLEAARRLTALGVRVAFVPATIDADVDGTERSLGHDSALAYALGVIAQLRITGRSVPERGFLVQTLGGGTRQLAEAVAAAAGIADVIVPGEPIAYETIARRFAAHVSDGEALAVIAEGAADPFAVAARLGERSGLRVHPTVLGHAQRAAPPTPLDLRAGRVAGRAAVEALAEGRSAYVALTAAGEAAPRAL